MCVQKESVLDFVCCVDTYKTAAVKLLTADVDWKRAYPIAKELNNYMGVAVFLLKCQLKIAKISIVICAWRFRTEPPKYCQYACNGT